VNLKVISARLAATGLMLSLVACEGRSKDTPDVADKVAPLGKGKSAAVQIDLSRGAPEQATEGGLFGLPTARNYAALVEALAAIRGSDAIKGVFVRFGTSTFDWARSEELGRLFGELRRGKRKIVCHAHSLTNSTLLLAVQACDRIWLSPAGDVDAVGIAGQVLYLKDLLDRFKVQAQFLHVGRYKSAAEVMTQSGPSDAASEAMHSVLGSLRATWLDGVAKARPEVSAKNAQVAEQGPYDAPAAKGLGLVDDIGYESEAEQSLKAELGIKEIETSFGLLKRRDAAKEILDLIENLVGVADTVRSPDHIALIVASGSIAMEPGGVFSDEGIAYRSLAKTVRRVAEDDSVKAVVLRINSPGGSALASDLLWHELMKLREKKPLIASVGEMAASGGYYLASASRQVFAERTSIVGSIGVVGGKLVLSEALREFGINSHTFAANEEPGAAARATYMSALTPWDEPTKERVQSQMNSIYELFLDRVSQGRGIAVEDIRPIAEGRIWSGEQGLQNKLVDTLGGLDDAIARARELGKLKKDASVKVEGAGDTLLDLLSLDESADEEEIRAAIQRWQMQPPTPLMQLSPDLRPFLGMLQPLLQGENVLTILPHGITVR
jgi:protease-4